VIELGPGTTPPLDGVVCSVRAEVWIEETNGVVVTDPVVAFAVATLLVDIAMGVLGCARFSVTVVYAVILRVSVVRESTIMR
jgi:hypothetical protein